jgi:polyhydroxybutyrate depolymerase
VVEVTATTGPTRRRRPWVRWVVLGVAVALVATVAAVAFVIWRTRSDQELVLPADGSPLPTTPPAPVEGRRALYSEMAVMQGSQRRVASILTPPDVQPGERLPLVFLLHGRGIGVAAFAEAAPWDTAVADDRFIAAFVQGVSDAWNAGDCCRPATTFGIDDLALLDAFVVDMSKRPDVDPARVFMAGQSNGGMMTYRYLCEHGDRLAGAASVLGTNMSGCDPNVALPVLHVAARDDEVVPYDGGRTGPSLLFASGSFPPVVESLEEVASTAGCGPEPARTDAASVHTDVWSGCRDGAVVELVTLDGARHVWPRGAPYDATDEILRFFGITS